MKKLLAFLLTLTILFNLFGCSSKVQSPDLTKGVDKISTEKRDSDKSFLSSQIDFTLNLFQSSVQKDADKNVLISPLSIMLALAMTANGADNETLTEMESVLANGYTIKELNAYLKTYTDSLPSNKDSKLKIANSIWYKNSNNLSINEEFLQNNVSYYNAQIYSSEFNAQTLKDINAWVSKNTDGMIPEILNTIDSNAVMYLINALCFDAKWDEPYEKHQIRDFSFTSIDNSEQIVPMMFSDEHYYLDDGKATGFIKDYKDGAYRFAALLPNEDVGIYDYISGLTYDALIRTLSNAENTKVETAIPKFEGEYDIFLNDILKEMGMSSAFDSGAADFSKMGASGNGNLYIDFVLHKTYISIDEAGTKASAVTNIAMKESASMIEKQVLLDRPFIYMILDSNTNLPLFIGTVMNINK